MAQNEPQHIETPPGPSPNSPSHHYYLNISVQEANLSDCRIESKKKSIRWRESNENFLARIGML